MDGDQSGLYAKMKHLAVSSQKPFPHPTKGSTKYPDEWQNKDAWQGARPYHCDVIGGGSAVYLVPVTMLMEGARNNEALTVCVALLSPRHLRYMYLIDNARVSDTRSEVR